MKNILLIVLSLSPITLNASSWVSESSTSMKSWETQSISGDDWSSAKTPSDETPPSSTWSPETFTDGDYTASPEWTAIGVSNAAWGVASERAVLTASGSSSAGGLWAESHAAYGSGVGLTFKPTVGSKSYVYLKACSTEPSALAQESGCYTVKFFSMANPTEMPGFGDCMFSFKSVEIFRDSTSLGYTCYDQVIPASDHALSLTISGGTVTASYGGGTVTKAASDSTYDSFSYVAFGVGEGDTSGMTTQFDDISYTE